MRPIGVDENSSRVVGVVRVAPDMHPLVDQQDFASGVGSHPFSHHRASESCPDHQIIEH